MIHALWMDPASTAHRGLCPGVHAGGDVERGRRPREAASVDCDAELRASGIPWFASNVGMVDPSLSRLTVKARKVTSFGPRW